MDFECRLSRKQSLKPASQASQETPTEEIRAFAFSNFPRRHATAISRGVRRGPVRENVRKSFKNGEEGDGLEPATEAEFRRFSGTERPKVNGSQRENRSLTNKRKLAPRPGLEPGTH
jgi:hypothetical protein